jgi:hypothetical protein
MSLRNELLKLAGGRRKLKGGELLLGGKKKPARKPRAKRMGGEMWEPVVGQDGTFPYFGGELLLGGKKKPRPKRVSKGPSKWNLAVKKALNAVKKAHPNKDHKLQFKLAIKIAKQNYA